MKVMSHQLQIDQARREARLWHRIANRLYDAHTDPDATPHDRHDAIETYLNYHNPHDDN